jgi:predicted  nucleic acid-binding Zn-ribbon protein
MVDTAERRHLEHEITDLLQELDTLETETEPLAENRQRLVDEQALRVAARLDTTVASLRALRQADRPSFRPPDRLEVRDANRRRAAAAVLRSKTLRVRAPSADRFGGRMTKT